MTDPHSGIEAVRAGHTFAVPEVDPKDDTPTRFVIWHFRYDAGRRERRNVLVTAYDNEAEFEQAIEALSRDLKFRKASGEAEDCEHLGGIVYEPGDRVERDRNAWAPAFRSLPWRLQRGAAQMSESWLIEDDSSD